MSRIVACHDNGGFPRLSGRIARSGSDFSCAARVRRQNSSIVDARERTLIKVITFKNVMEENWGCNIARQKKKNFENTFILSILIVT